MVPNVTKLRLKSYSTAQKSVITSCIVSLMMRILWLEIRLSRNKSFVLQEPVKNIFSIGINYKQSACKKTINFLGCGEVLSSTASIGIACTIVSMKYQHIIFKTFRKPEVSIKLQRQEWKFERTRNAVGTQAERWVFPQLQRVFL